MRNQMIPRLTTILPPLCVAAALAAPASAQMETTPEERAADAVVGIFFDRASASSLQTPRDLEDDARVDHWLATCSRFAGAQPEVQAALHRRLIDRARARRGGEVQALERYLTFQQAQPRHPWMTLDQRVGFYRRAYESVTRDRDARAQLAEPYIEVLLEQAQARQRSHQLEQAIADVRNATSVARTNDSPYASVLEDYSKALETQRRESQRLDQFAARVMGGNPTPADARALALRLACERSDFDGAIAAADKTNDDNFAQVMRYAALPADELEPMQALAVAELFRAAAEDPAIANDTARLGALMEAEFYYQHFLFGYTGRDVARLQAQDLAHQITQRIDTLRPDPIRRPPGRWATLTNHIAEPRVGHRGNLLEGNHLRVRNNTVYAHQSAFSIPANLHQSYDFRMVINRTHANDRRGMSLYFPIGRTGAHLQLGGGGDDGSRLDRLDQPFNLPNNFRFPEDTRVPLELTVHRKPGNRVHLVVTLAGRVALDWTGPIRTVATDRDRPPRSHGNTFRVGAGTTYEFSQIEVRRAGEE